jgi:hypothetical protein
MRRSRMPANPVPITRTQTLWRIAGLALVLVIALVAVSAAARVLGTGAHTGGSSHHKAKQERFKIYGRLARPLFPGHAGALNLRLRNRHGYSLRITRLTVSLRVDKAHRLAGCNRTVNFRIRRLKRKQYPIRLRPHRTRSLKRLRVKPLPRIVLRNLAFNQDACKGARLRLRYAGRATRWRAGR